MPHWSVPNDYTLSLIVDFGDGATLVEIAYNHYGGSTWYVKLNKCYYGRLWHTQHFGWHNDVNVSGPLCSDDVATIIDMITQAVGPPEF